jgi:hypothetical protein
MLVAFAHAALAAAPQRPAPGGGGGRGQAKGRQSPPRPPAPAKPDGGELRLRVLAVLHSVGDDARRWDDAGAAARVQAQVADLTWEADPGIARLYLTRGWEAARAVKDEAAEFSPYVNESLRADARREVMLIARRRAPELAEQWLSEMAAEEAKHAERKRGKFDERTERSAVLLRMAADTVEQNPQAAADLASASLQEGVSFGLQQVLVSLQGKDFDLARGVFRAAMSRLRLGGMSDPGELLILHSYLYTPGRVLAAGSSEERGSFAISVSREQPAADATAAERDPGLAREFLQLAAALLIESPMPSATADPVASARAQISTIEMLAADISQALPTEALLLKTRVRQIEADAMFSPARRPPPPGASSAEASGEASGGVEQMIAWMEEQAEREPRPLARDILYARAALAAPFESYERGLRSAKKIGDGALRANVSDLVAYGAAVRFAGAGDFERAYEAGAKINERVQRAAALVVGAQRLLKLKDNLVAARWLDEAARLAAGAERQEAAARVMLGLASAYAKVDRVAALEFFDSAVRLLEKSPALPADGRAPLVRKLSGLAFDDFTYETSGFGLDSALAAFGEEDFELLLHTLGRLSVPSTRGRAVVLLCRNQLQPRERPARAGAAASQPSGN